MKATVDIVSTETRRTDVVEQESIGLMKEIYRRNGGSRALVECLKLGMVEEVTVTYGIEQSYRERKRGRIRRRIRATDVPNRKFIHTNPIVTSISDISMKLEGIEVTDVPQILSIIEKNLDTYHLNPDLIACSYILYKRVNERLIELRSSGIELDITVRDKIIQQLVNKNLIGDLVSYIRGTTTILSVREAAEQLGIAESFITKELESEVTHENIIETKIMISILSYYDYIFGDAYESTERMIEGLKVKLGEEILGSNEEHDISFLLSLNPIGPFNRKDLLMHNYGMSTWESETSGKSRKDTILKRIVQEKESTGASAKLVGRKKP